MTTYIITGPPGAGKSTLANHLATQLEKGLHLHCDDIYNMVKGGYKAPWDDKDDVLKNLMFQSTRKIIETYSDSRFDCVVDYVFSLKQLRFFVAELSGKVVLKILLPKIEVNIDRDKNRQWVIGEERVRKYHYEFANEMAFKSFVVDTTATDANDLAQLFSQETGDDPSRVLDILGGSR